MEQKLSGQLAVIAGASSGLGAGVAKSMSLAGATVVVNYPVASNKDAAEAVLAEIKASGGQGVTAQCDVSKEDEVIGMFANIVKQFGTVDILVNNAGLQKDSPFENMTIDQWNTVIGVNLTGQFLCAREAIKEFLRRGVDPKKSKAAGKIIHMSSVHEVIPWGGHANYAASKGGIMLLMKSIAQEFAGRKIRINRKAWETPEALESLLTLIPYHRIGVPEDIGNVAVWLASDESDYINGA